MDTPETVFVELVADVPLKDDCRNGTKVVWHGKGDIKRYPAHLWPALAKHPDVWRLTDTPPARAPDPTPPAPPALTPEQIEALQKAQDDADALSRQKLADELAGQNIDTVSVIIDDKQDQADDQAGGQQQNEPNGDGLRAVGTDTRARNQATDETPVFDKGSGAVVRLDEALVSKPLTSYDDTPPESNVKTPRAPMPTTEEAIKDWTDDALRAEAEFQGFQLNPRLKSENLRIRFLEAAQELAKNAKAAEQAKAPE